MKVATTVRSPTTLVTVGFVLLLLVSGNVTFFNKLAEIYPPVVENLAFLFSVVTLTFGLILVVVAVISCLLPIRWVLSLLIALTMGAGYFSDNYGVVLDTTMIQNILETDLNESRALATNSFFLRAFLFGLLPILVLWRLPAGSLTIRELVFGNLRLAIAGVALICVCLGSFSAQYASFFREHKSVRFYNNPVFPVYSIVKYAMESFKYQGYEGFDVVMADAHLPSSDTGRELIIMVVGETARRDRFSLNGYHRDTNPRLASEPGVISYSNISACGTSTAVSVPCMFSELKAKDFFPESTMQRENILDVLQRSGVNVLWRDNNSDSKGVATRVTYEDFRRPDRNPACDSECRDVGMLQGLQEYVDSTNGDVLIVLHQMGSHGPAYHERYPAEFERFKPACQSAELHTCSKEEIDNAYDNTILYTDYFLSEVISFLKHNSDYETAMLYVSDHGESLGENGLYLHGLPMMLAPREQLEVPVIVWVGGASDIELASALEQSSVENSHDTVFSSLALAFELISKRTDEVTPLFSLHETISEGKPAVVGE